MNILFCFLFGAFMTFTTFEATSQILSNESIAGSEDYLITGTSAVIKRMDVDVDPNTGNKVFVWQEDPLGGSGSKDIYCSIYSPTSTLISTFVVNTTTMGDQSSPRVKINKSDNSFIVIWASDMNFGMTPNPNQSDIYAKKISFSNVETDRLNPDFVVNDYQTGNQIAPVVTFDYFTGEAVLAWIDQNGRDRLPAIVTGLDYGSYMRRISYTGNKLAYIIGGVEQRINNVSTVGHQTIFHIEFSPVTGLLYTSGHYQRNVSAGDGYDVVLATFSKDVSGNFVINTEVVVNKILFGEQTNPVFSIHSQTGDVVISWNDNSSGHVGYDCYAQIYNKSGGIKKEAYKIAPFVENNNELAPRPFWDESNGFLYFFFWYSAVGNVSVKYVVFDNNYAKYQDETKLITRNLNSYYAGAFKFAYDKLSSRFILAYDEYTTIGTSSKGYFSQWRINTVAPIPSYSTYLEKQVPGKEIKDINQLTGIPKQVANIARTYLDGMGRPFQSVDVQGSPAGNDMIQAIEYDDKGRPVKNYLPYVKGNDGGFKKDFKTEQLAFYQNNTSNNQDKIANDLFPFTQTAYENATMTKTMTSSYLGQSYALGTLKNISQLNGFNSDPAESIRVWTINVAGAATSSSVYPLSTLTVTKSVDVNGAVSAQYKDNKGNLVYMKLTAAGCTTETCQTETYNIYDDFGNIRFIIPPLAAAELKTLNNWTVNYNGASHVDKLVFCMKYDKRQRVIERKAPDKAIQYFVYNKLDQIVLVQNGNQRLSYKWKFNKYDKNGRKIMTGVMSDNRTQAQIQSDIDTKPLYETRSLTSSTGYTNVAYPIVAESLVLSIAYFDDYAMDIDNNSTTTHAYVPVGLSPEPVPTSQVKGYLTGVKNKNLTNQDWLIELYFYDKNGRMIQKRYNNHLDLSLQSNKTMMYDFEGKILSTKNIVSTSTTITTVNRFEYDNSGRTKKIYQKNNNNAEVLLCQFNYNELGQLIEKNLHSENDGLSFLQSVDYTYDISGQMTHINNASLANTALLDGSDNNNDVNDLFGMELLYEKESADIANQAQFGSRISAIKWKVNNTATSTATKAYKFSYDPLGRLSGSTFADNSSGSFQFGNTFAENNISYDQNGNIKTLSRYDQNGTLTDNLTYAYNESGNRLTSVADGSTNTSGFNDRISTNSEYNYDQNGNLRSDGNKGIVDIVYNALDLPSVVYLGSPSAGNRWELAYTASGKLLTRKLYKNFALVKKLDYVNGLYFEDDVLKYFQTLEGRAVPSTSGYAYQYHLRDHLGSIRVTFMKGTTGDAILIQEDNYYPFGLKLPQLSYRLGNEGGTNTMLYNGEEFQEGLDLNDDFINDVDWDVYDYGVRNYDPKLGRWNGTEPLADKYARSSSYAYAVNNPIKFGDAGGFDPIPDYSAIMNQMMANMMASMNTMIGNMMQSYTASIVNSVNASIQSGWASSQTAMAQANEATNMAYSNYLSSYSSLHQYIGQSIVSTSNMIQQIQEQRQLFAKQFEAGMKANLIKEFLNGNYNAMVEYQNRFGPLDQKYFEYRRRYAASSPATYVRKEVWRPSSEVEMPKINQKIQMWAKVADSVVPVVDNLSVGTMQYMFKDYDGARQSYISALDESIEEIFGLGLDGIPEVINDAAGAYGDANDFSISTTIYNYFKNR